MRRGSVGRRRVKHCHLHSTFLPLLCSTFRCLYVRYLGVVMVQDAGERIEHRTTQLVQILRGIYMVGLLPPGHNKL